MLKRFRFGSQDSITNPNPNIIRLAKITNPNIRDSEKKIRIRIRIRIFVTTLSMADGCGGCLSAAGYLESTNGEAVFTRFCEVKIYI